jgi:hypothetical protein
MSDIIERLRAGLSCEDDVNEVLLKDAISEIERLRNTIVQLRAVAGAVSVEGHSYADIRKEIRK